MIRNEYYRLLQHVHNAQCSRVKTAEVLVKAISSVQSFRLSSQNEVLASLAFQNICVLGSSLVAPPLELKQIMEPFHFLFLMTLGYKGKERDGWTIGSLVWGGMFSSCSTEFCSNSVKSWFNMNIYFRFLKLKSDSMLFKKHRKRSCWMLRGGRFFRYFERKPSRAATTQHVPNSIWRVNKTWN